MDADAITLKTQGPQGTIEHDGRAPIVVMSGVLCNDRDVKEQALSNKLCAFFLVRRQVCFLYYNVSQAGSWLRNPGPGLPFRGVAHLEQEQLSNKMMQTDAADIQNGRCPKGKRARRMGSATLQCSSVSSCSAESHHRSEGPVLVQSRECVVLFASLLYGLSQGQWSPGCVIVRGQAPRGPFPVPSARSSFNGHPSCRETTVWH